MEAQRVPGHNGRTVDLDVCVPCQSFWFDTLESVALAPGGTLSLFRLIGDRTGRPHPTLEELAKCPRCRGRLRLAHDLQRQTRFAYLRCPNGHGRLITFLEFLKEKQFIRALTAQQIAELRANVQAVHCANCGAPVDLVTSSSCGHCRSPLSMLDMEQAQTLVDQLRAADRTDRPVDPALPLALERARRQTEASFANLARDLAFTEDLGAGSLVVAGLKTVARWLKA